MQFNNDKKIIKVPGRLTAKSSISFCSIATDHLLNCLGDSPIPWKQISRELKKRNCKSEYLELVIKIIYRYTELFWGWKA